VLPPLPIEHGQIAVRIDDLAGRFNINSLVQDQQVNRVALARFQRLLRLLA
jgi:general secretion pathway protein K